MMHKFIEQEKGNQVLQTIVNVKYDYAVYKENYKAINGSKLA
jgi:hypothetical protein